MGETNDEATVPAPTPSRQEMFDRAFRGLRSQGFAHTANPDNGCRYHAVRDMRVLRCAWGWVDPEATEALSARGENGSVRALRIRHHLRDIAPIDYDVGLMGRLTAEEAEWVSVLQSCHDGAAGPHDMEARLRALALGDGLTVPE